MCAQNWPEWFSSLVNDKTSGNGASICARAYRLWALKSIKFLVSFLFLHFFYFLLAFPYLTSLFFAFGLLLGCSDAVSCVMRACVRRLMRWMVFSLASPLLGSGFISAVNMAGGCQPKGLRGWKYKRLTKEILASSITLLVNYCLIHA